MRACELIEGALEPSDGRPTEELLDGLPQAA
jgi:hypothetical protein